MPALRPNIVHLLPKDKFDHTHLQAIRNLETAEFLSLADELLSWLQDADYPIFHDVLAVLVHRQDEIMSKVKAVFHTDDFIWQYWILVFLYPKLSLGNQQLLRPEIERLSAQSPSANEDEQQLILWAQGLQS